MSRDSRAGSAAAQSPAPAEIERSTARYLYAVADLAGAGGDRVSTGELRKHLGVSPASVTEMLAKLDDRGLVAYEKYRGAVLTARGERLAALVAWRVCVVSTFFESVLDTTLDEETAFDVGYALPESGVSRLGDRVTGPCLDRCPEAETAADECPV